MHPVVPSLGFLVALALTNAVVCARAIHPAQTFMRRLAPACWLLSAVFFWFGWGVAANVAAACGGGTLLLAFHSHRRWHKRTGISRLSQ